MPRSCNGGKFMRPANGRRVRVYGQHSQLSRCHVTSSHTSRDITGAVMTSVMWHYRELSWHQWCLFITGAVMTSVMSLHQRSLHNGMSKNLQRTVIQMISQSPSLRRNGLKRERVSCNVECWKLLGVVYLIHINVLFHLDVCSSVPVVWPPT